MQEGHWQSRVAIKGKNSEKFYVNATAQKMEQISIFCGTFNLSGNALPTDSEIMKDFIPPGKFDIYAIALQESNSFTKNNAQKEREFDEYFIKIMGEEYLLLSSEHLWEMRLMVFIKKRHHHKVTNVAVIFISFEALLTEIREIKGELDS